MAPKKIKILYLFAGTRKEILEQWLRGEMPDTYLVGFNHLREFSIEAQYFENKFINFLRRINFNLVYLPLLFKIREYDLVFSGASLLIVFLAKIVLGFSQPKFVCYNTFLTNLHKRNSRGLKSWLLKKTVQSLDAIVCPSQAQREYLIVQGYDRSKIFYVPTGVDVDFISQRQKEQTEEPEKKFILSVGKDPGRDYRTLIEAAKNLAVGIKIIAFPRNFAKTELDNLPFNISVCSLPFMELVKWYKKAAFVVVPTKKEENPDAADCSGHYVILDSMASAKAVIASQRQTIIDYIVDGQEGILVEPENSLQLKIAMERLLANPGLAQKLGQNGYEKVKKFFTTKIMAQNLAKIFLNLCPEK